MTKTSLPQDGPALLAELGRRLRDLRQRRGLTQKALGERAGVSPRFLVQVEGGEGNLSVLRLAELAEALGVSLTQLVVGLGPGDDPDDALAARALALPPEERAALLSTLGAPREKIALVGLRGAGKSTVGAALAARLGCPFVELDREVEARGGMRIAELFEYHGADRYRALAGEVLSALLAAPGPAVIELGGSAVTDAALFSRLRQRAWVLWLRASPQEHLRRVQAQGDLRPMTGRADALGELRGILAAREPIYAQSDLTLDTEALGVEGAVETACQRLGAGR
jgi:XRE family aerobic/anaerobic benzoate catabolism transcriptional regulator